MGARVIEAIVIGGSAGALEALMRILPALPASFPIPVAIVLHVLAGKPTHLAEVLGAKCAMPVKEPEDKEPIAAATVYVAPSNYHLLVERTRHFSLSVDEPVNFSRPSIDVLFESAADAYRSALAGVVLAGSNDDGAKGLARIKEAGGIAIVQSPETAPSREMPDAALRRTIVDHVLPLDAIGPLLTGIAGARTAREDA